MTSFLSRSFAFRTLQKPVEPGIKMRGHTRKYKFSHPQSYFLELRDSLSSATDKEQAVQKLLPQIRDQIRQGLGARQIYKSLQPIALLNTPETDQQLERLLTELVDEFSKNDYRSP